MVIILQIILTLLFMFQDYVCENTTEQGYKVKTVDSNKSDARILGEYYYRRAIEANNSCAKTYMLGTCLKLKEVKNKVNEECGVEHEAQEDCQPYRCAYDKIGTAQNPGPYRQYIKEYIEENPEMKEAVEISLAKCIDVQLRPQGVLKNCSAYDTLICINNEFIKNMPTSVWNPECTEPRELFIKCTVCPINCRAQAVMEPGTCFACADI